MKKTLALTVALLLANCPVLFAGVGTASIDILKVSSGIKAQGMGGAYVAAVEDVEAMDLNPAGLAYVQKPEAMFIHDLYLQDIFYDSLYYATGLGDAGSLGFCLKYLNAGVLTETLETAGGTYAGEGSEVSGYDFLAAAGYGLTFGEAMSNIKAGGALKVSGESLGPEYSNLAVSADVGLIYVLQAQEANIFEGRNDFAWNKGAVAIVFKNLGTSFNGNMTPVSIALGGYTQMINIGFGGNRLRLSLDTDYNMGTGINLRVGAEYRQEAENFAFALRAGGDFNPAERIGGALNFGGSLGMKSGGSYYGLEYVFTPFGELGANQKIGLYLRF